MLLRFGTENHYSVRDYQSVSLVATRLKDNETGLLPVQTSDNTKDPLSAVPVLALYGANASGKSSFIHAFSFMTRFIRNSQTATSKQESTPYFPFLLDSSSRKRPSTYDADVTIGDTRYHYGFKIDGKQVISEWLYSFPLSGTRQAKSVLFHRDMSADEQFYFGKGLKGENKQIAKLVRPNSLFLSAAAQNAHPQLTPLTEYFQSKISLGTKAEGQVLAKQLAQFFSDDVRRRTAAIEFLRAADTGISGITFQNRPLDEDQISFATQIWELMSSRMGEDAPSPEIDREMAEVTFTHISAGGESFPIQMSDESTGTAALLTLLGPVIKSLSEGGVLVVDELSTTLHPLVSRRLLELFSDPATNSGRAQLIFSTHDTNLLCGKLLRRDQVVLVEKDKEGCSHLFPLSDIKVRNTENIERGYLEGRFGGIPFLGKFDWSSSAAFAED